jgi:20S proteasome, alpha and beta subunits
VEYAIEAIKLGSTAIGICTSEGVVLAVEKRITSPLMELTTIEKIVEVDKHIGKSLVYRRKSLRGVRFPS